MKSIGVINSENAPAAIGPYSQARKANGLIYTSGQLPLSPESGEMANGIAEQTKRSLENVKAILEAGGSDMNRVLKTTVYLSDIKNFAAMNEVYAGYFTDLKPARSAFEVACLPMNALVEIEAVAVCDSK